MGPFLENQKLICASPTLQKSIFHLSLEKKNPHTLWFIAEEENLRFSLTSCSTPSPCPVYCLQLYFSWKVSVCVRTDPNRLRETENWWVFLLLSAFTFLNWFGFFSPFNPFIAFALSICVQFNLHWFKMLGHFLMINMSNEILRKSDLTLWQELWMFWVWPQGQE